jgi:uncharacterized protein YcfL
MIGETMTKKITLLFFCIVLLYGCESGYNVIVKDDPYKQSILIKLETRHKVMEGNLENETMTYEREIKTGKKSPVTIFFRFYAGPYLNGKEMEDRIYLLIDGHLFTLPITNKKTETQIENEYAGSNRRYYFNNPAFIRESRYLTGKFELNPEIEQALSNSRDFSLRVYMDSESTTLKATENQLVAVKRFLAAGP